MSSYENVTENIKTASEAKPLSMTSAEHVLVARVAGIPKRMKLGCTNCGYCMLYPKGMDIPA